MEPPSLPGDQVTTTVPSIDTDVAASVVILEGIAAEIIYKLEELAEYPF